MRDNEAEFNISNDSQIIALLLSSVALTTELIEFLGEMFSFTFSKQEDHNMIQEDVFLIEARLKEF